MNDRTSDPLRMTANAAREVLEYIIDPCSTAIGAPAGLASMGLVLDGSVAGRPGAAVVHVTLGITEPGCMMQGIFAAAAEHGLRALPGVRTVVVSIDHGHVWSPDDMTAEYRARLSRVRAERKRRGDLFLRATEARFTCVGEPSSAFKVAECVANRAGYA